MTSLNDVVLVFLLLTWTYFTPLSKVSIVEFEQVNVGCVNGSNSSKNKNSNNSKWQLSK